MKHIGKEHLMHWQEHGYAIVEDFLRPEELAAAQREIHQTFPSLAEYQYAPSLYRNEYSGGHSRHLPFLGDVLNLIAVNPEIVAFAEQVLETKKIALVTSHVWAKYPGADDFNMPLHTDYSSSTILYPNKLRPVGKMITFILYYVDVDEQLGPTYVVSEQHSKDELLVPDIRPKAEYPELYQYEKPVSVRAGSLLVYSMTAFHRGSAITSRNRIRYSHHITYQADEAPWMGYCVWAKNSLSPELRRFIGLASHRQRELFGFPPLGHSYWNQETLTGIAALYPLIDMTPYLESADIPEKQKARLREELSAARPKDTKVPGSIFPGKVPSRDHDPGGLASVQAYYRAVADYCAVTTGVPAAHWMPGLLAYHRLSISK